MGGNTSRKNEVYIPLEDLDTKPAAIESAADDMNDTDTTAFSGAGSLREQQDDDQDSILEQDFYFPDKRGFFTALWNGPRFPTDEPPVPIQPLQKIDDYAERFHEKVPRPAKISLLAIYLSLWAMLSYSIVVPYFTKPPMMGDTPVISLSCNSQINWRGKNAACGLDAKLCEVPQDQDVIFRCPALCDRSWTYSLIPIGDQRIKYRGYFVGGGAVKNNGNHLSDPYRADSYACGAAVHSGIVSPSFGGCARVSYKSGLQQLFPAAKGKYGVGDSIEFLSFFPSSFFFRNIDGKINQCYDPRFLILVLNIILGIPVVFLAKGATIYWVINTVGFWTICLATDPPRQVDSLHTEQFADLISISLERFLPSCFILYVLWHCSAKRTLSDPPLEMGKPSPVSRLIYWYPLFWLGVLNNITFDRLNVDRFTLHDLKEQPGSIFAVGSLVSTIVVCAVIQAYKIWLSGRFQKYLAIYATFFLSLFLISCLPGLTLRIHHYILGMVLIPGCATRGRTALLFQGILGGLFLSGAARWGLAAIAETIISLKRDDPLGKLLPPDFINYDQPTGLLSWTAMNITDPLQRKLNEKYSSFSLLINDVERYVGNETSVNLQNLVNDSSLLKQLITQALESGYKDAAGNILLYLRIGRKVPEKLEYSDFSNGAVMKWPSGDFALPLPGIT